LQMEVCDLNECDFLETKFTEYPDYQSYKEDSKVTIDEHGTETFSLTTTKDDLYKGTIIYFHTKEGKPHYEYMPLHISTLDEITEWEHETMSKYENEVFVKFIYWKLEKMSCILVKRNQDWFNTNVRQLEKVWNIIEKERVTGYEHRAPIKRRQKSTTNATYPSSGSEVCLLKVIKMG